MKYTFLITFFLCLYGNNYGQSRWDNVKCNCDSIKVVCQQNPCIGLSLISDSIYFYYKLNPDCINAIHGYYRNTAHICHFLQFDFREQGIAFYKNLSFGKSLYKMDLLLWMKYFGCSDTNHLTQKKYGDFDESERDELKWEISNGINVDTSFLSE